MTLEDRITKHEGFSLTPYMDCCRKSWRECKCPPETQGTLTGGVGINLDAGLTAEEWIYLRDSRIRRARNEAATFIWFTALSPVRQDVILDMLYNLGLTRFCGFRKMIKALEQKDFERAYSEMLNSDWAGQVKSRAVTLADMMRTGVPF